MAIIAGEDNPSRTTQPDVRAALVARLRRRRGEIEQALFARVSSGRFERVGSDDPQYMAGMREATATALEYILSGVEHAGESPPTVPQPVIVQAQRAADAGVGLDTVLRRYQTGQAVLADFLMQEAEQGEPPCRGAALREVLQIVAALLDRMTVAVSGAYRGEIERIGAARAYANGTRSADVRARGRASRAQPRSAAGQNGARRVAPRRDSGAQRERIMDAMVVEAAERGFQDATVARVAKRAGVSTRTFYEQFADKDACAVAIMDRTLERVSELVSWAFAGKGKECWRDGMLDALAAVLGFFDADRHLAQVCMVETLRGGPAVLERREHVVRAFRQAVTAHIEAQVSHPSPLAADGVLASVMMLAYAHLRAPEQRPLIELLGPLMGVIVGEVEDEQTAAEEVRRGARLAGQIQAGDGQWTPPVPVQQGGCAASEVLLPAQLANPSAHRGRECLIYLAAHPGSSNRQIADAVGIAHDAQISRLLSYLRAQDLACCHSEGVGKHNAWRLTALGEEVRNVLGAYPT